MNRHVITIVAFGLLAARNLDAQETSPTNAVFQDGERLRYKVKFGPIRLGTIQFFVHKLEGSPDEERYQIDLRIDSNPALFFVDLHEFSFSIVHPESLYSEYFYRSRMKGSAKIESWRIYDRLQRESVFMERDQGKGSSAKQIVLRDLAPYFEGPSLWLFARSKVMRGGEYTVQNILDTTRCQTVLSFKHARSVLEIDAIDGRVMARQAEGDAEWTGDSFGGMTGNFRGWFSDDEAAVPLLARFKIAVGNVVLELEDWHRPGWTPPDGKAAAWR
ncbi:MAG TPA: DUF3108 domain-containing protein [Bacteroidota bacterium]